MTVYRVRNGEYIKYAVRWSECGAERRLHFSDLEVALEKARLTATRLENGERTAISMSGVDAQGYGLAMDKLRPLGVPLHVAVDQFAAATHVLNRVSLIEAARFYVRYHAAKHIEKPVPQVVEEFIAAREADGASIRYLEDCRSRLRRFGNAFYVNISAVATTEIEAWLRKLQTGPRTRNNFRGALVTLFHFARNRAYLPKAQETEADQIARAKDREGEIRIFKPEAVEKLLNAADQKLRPYIAIRAFAGVRDAEIKRLDWVAVRFDHGDIEVGAKHAKTAARRLVPMPENLKAWLEPYRGSKGKLCGYANSERLARKLADQVEVEWVHNGLRHSFVSYRVAETSDVAKVALEAGNSPEKIFSNYRALVTAAEAKAYFSILPGTNT